MTGIRRKIVVAVAGLASLAAADPAFADEQREFCPDRPGIGTPACIIDKGRVAVETGILDWSLDKAKGSRTDTFSIGDTLVRYGVTDSMEVQVEWLPYAFVRERDALGVSHSGSSGDVMLAVRQSLHNPDGSGFSAALMPFATLPTGGHAAGSGDWSAGLIAPISQELEHGLQLALTPSIEAAVDEDRSGRHLAYGLVAGLQLPVSDKIDATVEISGQHDDDPSGASTSLQSGFAAAWSVNDDLQLDAGTNVGLDRDAPDIELYFGISRRF